MTIMPESYAAKKALIAELCRPLAVTLLANGEAVCVRIPATFQFTPLTQAPGFELARLLAPAGHSATLLRGIDGAHSPRFATAQAVRLEVLAGALLWWQEAQGPKGDPNSYRRLDVGDITELGPDEQHSYVALSPCLTYNLFTPALEEAG
jgi:hypothetical protein